MLSLSDHLFWDVDRSSIEPERHAPWLVKRVLEYGRWNDWQVVKTQLRGMVSNLD